MAAPQGYTALGLVGYTDKGTYLASATYNRYNVVLYNGSSYVAIKDGITGVTPSNDGVNWRLFANGFPENGITTDNFQETLKQYISNSGTVNQEGFALDARQGNDSLSGTLANRVKENEDAISELNSGFQRGASKVDNIPYNQDYNTEITFDIPFKTVPVVICNCDGNGSNVFANAEAISLTGFRVQFRNISRNQVSLSTTVNWFAYDG